MIEHCNEKQILHMCDLPRFRELLKCYRLSTQKWGEKHFWAVYLINPTALCKQTTLIYRTPERMKTHKAGVQTFWKKFKNRKSSITACNFSLNIFLPELFQFSNASRFWESGEGRMAEIHFPSYVFYLYVIGEDKRKENIHVLFSWERTSKSV